MAPPLIPLQRTIGNQAVQRMLQRPPAKELTVSRIVQKELQSSGQPLASSTRRFMEARFGHDFDRVRVHADARAQDSADALRARAYTVGSDVFFGRGAYAPETEHGRSLLAHELAHVVQQRNARPPADAKLEIGNPSDGPEQEAAAAARAAVATTHMPDAEAARSMPRLSAPSLSQPVLRRVPQKTWGGVFEPDEYRIEKPVHDARTGEGRYGVHMQLRFKPNERVDAEKIALVQTAQSLVDGKPWSVHAGKKGDVTLGRSIPEFEVGQGTHIDQAPESRTPLFGMVDPAKGDELAESTPGRSRITRPGRRRPGTTAEDAVLVDPAGLKVPDKAEASQEFETTALALAGPQKGAFYGSVRWGWKKDADAKDATKMDFVRVSEDAPSSIFAEAAKLWNVSKTSEGKETIDLPIPAGMYANVKKEALLDKPGKGRSVGNLDLNTRLEVTEQTDPKFKDWANVVVVSGLLAGKVGWVRKAILSSSATPEIKPKKPRK